MRSSRGKIRTGGHNERRLLAGMHNRGSQNEADGVITRADPHLLAMRVVEVLQFAKSSRTAQMGRTSPRVEGARGYRVKVVAV